MGSPILVTGGTGTLGRAVVSRLRDAGCDIRVLSRQDRTPEIGAAGAVEHVTGDLSTGAGVEAAVAGTKVVVHCAGSARGDEVKARTLVRAAVPAGVQHLVYVSVVGADRVPVVSAVDRALFGYFAMKRAAELVVAGSGIPWTTLRASQFHELTFATVRQMTRMPVVPVPSGFRFQPVAGDEVAARMAELAMGAPAGLVPDIAGPRDYAMTELVRGYLAARGKHRPLVPVRLPGRAANAVRAGANLAPEHAVGRRTWEDFLAAQAAGPDAVSAHPERGH